MAAVRARRRTLISLIAAILCGMTGTALAAIPAWTTYHHDAGRSGIDPDSTSPLPPTQVWQTPTLDGPMWSQPLVYGNDVYVATENDTVYALNAATGAVVWQRHVATAVPASQLPCGDVSPVGITSTPVIDPATGRIYVVGDTWDGSHASSIAHEMYALNLSDGSVAVGPVAVDPPGSVHADQLQRASLALDAGKVIIGYGGNDGDCGSYHGWLVAVPEGGGGLQTFEVDPTTNQGAIWGSGNAPAIDSAGDIWTSTGNGSSGSFDYQESVVRLDSNLQVVDWWAPSNWSSLDSSDTDLGSSMPLLLPDGLVFQIGKAGVGYLLNAANLGRTNSGPPLYQASVCSGSWGGAIYAGGVIYVACSDGTHALSLNAAAHTFAPVSGWTVNSNASGPPIYAGGLVWSASSGVGSDNGTLYGLDPGSGATRFSVNLGSFEHFTTPSAGGSRLFVANGSKVTAFQVANAPGATATALTLTSSKNPALLGQPVTYSATVTPTPDAGTVEFADNGTPIAGCASVALAGAQATCTASFGSAKRQAITAIYSGDGFYAGSSSTLTQLVTALISRLHVTVVHRRLRIRLVLSEPAKVVASVARLVPGRKVGRTCRVHATRGRRCTVKHHQATLRMRGQTGTNRFRPRMRKLPAGRYAVKLTATTATGARSRTVTVVLVVR